MLTVASVKRASVASARYPSVGMKLPFLCKISPPLGRYYEGVAHATKHARPEVERRRKAAERMRGLFADLAPGRSLSDELIAERRAEARAEDREAAEEAQRLRGRR